MSQDVTIRRVGDPRQVGTAAEFAAALTDVRLRAGLSIRDVARATGIPSGTLGGYFSGRHLPPTTQPQLFGQVLDALRVHDPDEVAQWREALLRVRRGGPARAADPLAATALLGDGGSAAASTQAPGPSPYRGLEPFTEADAHLFFGREATVDELVASIDERAASRDLLRMLIVVGPSGSGKSSVLRAGLLPRLRSRSQGPWAVTLLVPGADPLGALAVARAELAEAPRGLLVLDQAEEVFGPQVSAQDRATFLGEIVAAAQPDGSGDRATVVVVGLRADFYGQAAADPNLLPALRSAQVLLGAMPLADLRRAIVSPAESVGVHVEPELVELLLRDLSPRGQVQSGYDAGALPLVSHALLATWGQHSGDRLTAGDYVAAGGIAGAVQQTAELVFAGLDEPGRAATQWLFAQLVSVDDDGVMTRRRVNHDDLHHPDRATDLALDAAIEAFVSGRLLTAGDRTLEVSHEALLTAWPRLSDWVRADLDAARAQRRINDAAAIWRERDRDPAALLRGGPLAQAQDLAAQPATSPRVLTSAEQEFVSASTAAQEAQRSTERRRTTRLRALVAVLAVLALLAGLLAAIAVRSADEARAQEQAASAARDEATSRQLAITANDLRTEDPALAAQLSLAAFQVSPTLQARSSLLTSTGTPTPTRFVGPAGEMHAVANPDGSVLALSGVDGITRLWRAAEADTTSTGGYVPAGELPAVAGAHSIYSSAFSPDGTLLALGSSQGWLTLWNVADLAAPALVASPTQVDAPIQSLAFSPDGRQLAGGTSEPALRRWALSGGTAAPTELPALTAEFGGIVQSVAYHPDGQLLATGSADGTVRIWSTATTGTPTLVSATSVGEATNFVFSVAFSPDGNLLASGGKDRVARLWDVRDPSAPAARGEPLGTFTSWVNTVTFAPDGASLVAGSSDGAVATFAVADGAPLGSLPNPSAVTAAQFVGTGGALLTSELDGIARLWPLPGPVLGGFGDAIWALSQDSDQALLGVGPGAGDGSVHLYDRTDSGSLTPRTVLTTPADAGPGDGSAAMSADGRWVAAGTAIGKVVVWERAAAAGDERTSVLAASDTLVEGVTFSADSQLLAAIADDGSVGVWTLAQGSDPAPLHQLSIEGLPLGVAFSPDGTLLAVGGTGNQVALWDISGPQARELPALAGFENYVYGLAFSPDARHLAAGSTDRTVRIWDLSDPAAAVQVGDPLRGPGGTIYALSWATDDAGRARLAGAAKDGLVWLWDVTDPAAPAVTATLGPAVGQVNSVLLGAGGTRVSSAGADRVVVTWQTGPERTAATLCQSTGTPMSQPEWEQLAPGVPYAPPCGTASTPTS